jgi:HAD superfamily hydrolase (TIGR01549 family)
LISETIYNIQISSFCLICHIHSFVETEYFNFETEQRTRQYFYIRHLREKNIKICLGSGLERDVFNKICCHLKWEISYFDYIGISGETGRSRPHPDMIFYMMNKLQITDPGCILKVSDTVADIHKGKNAKVLTAVILSGTQVTKELLLEEPDFGLTSLAGIKEILEQKEVSN